MESASGSQRTVLIVDDSQVVRSEVKRALGSPARYNFLEAENGIVAFKMLVKNPVDVILCDVIMPGVDGFKFLHMIQGKKEFVEIPVIMLTGQEHVSTKVRGFRAGASDYVTKPFQPEELVARVEVHLKIKELQDELRMKNAALEELSATDGLTKVKNRRYLMETLALEFQRAERYESDLAYVMIDLDHFKRVNDKYGHQVGDQALIEVARRLREGLRDCDVVARYGGEEFGLLLPQTGIIGARQMAERFRQGIENVPLKTREYTLQLTASFGVAAFPHASIQNFDDLIRRADAALYQAKADGRNRVCSA